MTDRVARHEAGHAVVAHLLGLPLDSATVVPVPGDYLGCVCYAATPALTGAAAEARDRKHLVASLAGRAAVGDGLGAASDHDHAWKYARKLVGDDPEDAPTVGQLVKDCWEECRQLVRANGQVISDVARLLALFGTLTGEHLTRVIEDALASQAYWAAKDAGRWAFIEDEGATA